MSVVMNNVEANVIPNARAQECVCRDCDTHTLERYWSSLPTAGKVVLVAAIVSAVVAGAAFFGGLAATLASVAGIEIFVHVCCLTFMVGIFTANLATLFLEAIGEHQRQASPVRG